MKLHMLALFLLSASAAATTPDKLLDEMQRAIGGSRWETAQQLDLEGTLQFAGMTGRIEQVVSLRDSRRSNRFDLSVAAGSDGYDGAHGWHADAGGLVDVDESEAGTRHAISESFVSNRLYLRDRVAMTQQVLRREADTYVLAFTPKGGEPLELWIDARTHLVSRTVLPESGETTRWSDYRRVAGVMLPHRIESTDSSNNPQTILVEQYRLNTSVEVQRLAKPQSRASDTELASGAHTLPAHIENGHVYVEASINGAPNSLFILDTGASINILTPDAARALGVNSQGSLNATGVGESQIGASLASVASVRVGPATLRQQSFAILELPPLSATRNGKTEAVMGLLGYDFFRRLRITIDYEGKIVRLESLRSCGQRPHDAVPLFLDEGRVPRIPLTIAGVEALWSLDVGDAGSLTMAPTIAQRIGVPADAGVVSVNEGGVGGTVRTRLLQFDGLGIGPFRIATPVIAISDQKTGAFADSKFAGNVGYGTLRQFVPTFDYECRTMELERSAVFGSPAPYNGAGMSWRQEQDGTWRVLHVMSGSPADAAGVRSDDTLIAANGKPAASLTFATLRDMHYAAPGTQLRLEIERGREHRTFELTLARFVPSFAQ